MEQPNQFLPGLPEDPDPTVTRKLALIFLGAIVVLVFSFLALFTYYFYVVQYGNETARETLYNTFTPEKLSSDSRSPANASDTIATNIQEFIRPYNPTAGSDAAPVTIIAFIDFECPFCRAAYPTFESIQKTYGPAIRIVFKHFPIASIHPHAQQSALAAQCASDQGAFWEYYRLLFERQDLSEKALLNYATILSLDTTQFSQCLSTEKYANEIQQDIQDGIAAGVRGTPTYAINQQRIEGAVDAARWETAILHALQ